MDSNPRRPKVRSVSHPVKTSLPDEDIPGVSEPSSAGFIAKTRPRKRRHKVIDPKTMRPVQPSVSAEDDSFVSKFSSGLGSDSEIDEKDLYQKSARGESSKVDTALLDKLEEREFLARHARRIRLAGLLGALVGMILVLYVVFLSPVFAYHQGECEVSGNVSLNSQVVCEVTKQWEGIPLSRLSCDGVAKTVLKGVAQLQDVKVERQWPHGLYIRVVERVPVATVREKGKIVGVDQDAVVLEVAPAATSQLPQLDVDLEKLGGSTKKLVDAALEVFGDMPAELRSQIAKVTSEDPVQLSFSLRDGRELVWGSVKDSVYKAQVAQLLLTVENVKLVDVSNPLRPSTR